MRIRGLVCAPLCAALTLYARALPSSAQQPPASESQFRSGIDLFQLNVSVLDRDRKPVRGLTATDFSVTVDGKRQPIEAFTSVDLPPVAAPPTAWMRDVTPDVVSNVVPEQGRYIVILFDTTISPALMPAARKIARAAVDAMGPGDLAAVIYTSRGMPQDFTASRALLLAAIEQPFMGLPDGDDGNPGECYCGLCHLDVMTSAAEALQETEKRPKELLFIGTRIAFQGAGDCILPVKIARERLFATLDRTNMIVNTVDPSGLLTLAKGADVHGIPSVAAQTDIGRMGDLGVLPDRTGGRLVMNVNNPEADVPAIFAENQSYYVLGIRPPDLRKDLVPERVQIKVAKSGVSVVSARIYGVPVAAPAPPKPTGPMGPPPALVSTMSTPLPLATLPLSVTAVPFALPGSTTAAVLVIVDAHLDVAAARVVRPAAGASTSAIPVSVLAGAFDRNGKGYASHHQELSITPGPRAGDDVSYEVLSRLTLSRGRYQIRAAVNDGATATSGSVYTYVDVPDFASAPLSLSGLVLSAPPGTVSAPDTLASDLLPFIPTGRRAFLTTERVTALVRVYQGGKDALASVRVHARIVDARDQSVFDRVDDVPVDRFASARAADDTVDLPLSRLTPGEYLLTIDAARAGQTASRDVRFRVR